MATAGSVTVPARDGRAAGWLGGWLAGWVIRQDVDFAGGRGAVHAKRTRLQGESADRGCAEAPKISIFTYAGTNMLTQHLHTPHTR